MQCKIIKHIQLRREREGEGERETGGLNKRNIQKKYLKVVS